MKVFWHIIKSGRFSKDVRQAKWSEELSQSYVSAGYGNALEGMGKKKLLKYAEATLLAYVPGSGLVGIGHVTGDPGYFAQDSTDEHAHRLAVTWEDTVVDISQAVSVAEIRAMGLTPPRTLATKVDSASVEPLRQQLRAKAA